MSRRTTRRVATACAALAAGAMIRTAAAQVAWVEPIEHCESAGCATRPTYFEWPHTLMHTTSDGGVVSTARYGQPADERFGGVVVKRDAVTGRERWRYARIGDDPAVARKPRRDYSPSASRTNSGSASAALCMSTL